MQVKGDLTYFSRQRLPTNYHQLLKRSVGDYQSNYMSEVKMPSYMSAKTPM